MKQTLLYVVGITLSLSALLTPLSASALGLSFGGKIVGIHFGVVLPSFDPCVSISIIPAGAVPTEEVWVGGTVGVPPAHPGQQILGVADVPVDCVGVGLHPPIWVGLRMQIDGVSI